MKRAQFGPDALVGMVVVAVIGLGGIFFLNTFVNGITLEGMISILDQEIDQRCFFMILPLIGDEYIREGDNVSKHPEFSKMYNYFGGDRRYIFVSNEFNTTLVDYTTKLKTTPLGQKPTYIEGYLASKRISGDLRKEIMDELKEKGLTIKQFCFIPIYNPTGQIGTAELFVAEDTDACGIKGKECCPGNFCDPGLKCSGGRCVE